MHREVTHWFRMRLRKRAIRAIERCILEHHPQWKNYGGRGIKVHAEWIESPMLFVEYLMTLPNCSNLKLVLDRIDNDGHYEPGNLQFVTHEESVANRRKPVCKKENYGYPRGRWRYDGEVVEYAKANYPKMRAIRLIKGLTLAQMSALSGVGWTKISEFEHGKITRVGEARLPTLIRAYIDLNGGSL